MYFCVNLLGMKKLLIALLLLSNISISRASITTAQFGANNWTQAASWTNGVPGCFDTIYIPFGSTMNVNSQIDLTLCPNPVFILVEGTLKFNTGQKLNLPTFSMVQVQPGAVVEPGNGGGSSNLIEIGGSVLWTSGNGPLTGPVSVCEFCFILLGVEYESGYYEIDGRNVDFYWETASENENDYFTLERSTDGKTWGHVAQISGEGTTSESSYYRTKDLLSNSGTYYYALYQTDFDGEKTLLQVFTVTYSPVKTVIGEYDLMGRSVNSYYRGVVIQQFHDGSSIKIVR